jgi:hypothetical protein
LRSVAETSPELTCPEVKIAPDSAALRRYAGGSDADKLQNQISIGNTARSCDLGSDGIVTIKVGVEIRALLGPAGKAGALTVPLTVRVASQGIKNTGIKSTKPLAQRVVNEKVVIPAGQSSASVEVVETVRVPASALRDDVVIDVGLGKL